METPEPNLPAGRRVLPGTFSQAWDSRHLRRGHVFQGRYKAGATIRKQGSVTGAAMRAHGEIEAERIIRRVGGQLGLA